MIPATIVLVIFGYALNPKVRNLRLGVVDQSFTAESRDLIDALTENVNFDVTRVYTRPQDAEDALKNLDLDLFLVIPHDFARSLNRGQTGTVQVVIDAVDANTAQIAQGYLKRCLEAYNTSRGSAIPTEARPRRTLTRATHPAPEPGAVDVSPAYLYNPGLVTAWHYVTGVMSIIMFINASLVASALAVKEKETGTIEQLLMTPAQTVEMLFAKVTPVFILMMVVMFFTGTGILVSICRCGALWMFAVAGACALAGIGIDQLVATVRNRAEGRSDLFVNPPILCGGATSPVRSCRTLIRSGIWLRSCAA